jgi:hypothetical protein
MKPILSCLLIFLVLNVRAKETQSEDETGTSLRGGRNCSEVETILDNYCNTVKCRNLLTNLCFVEINADVPTCDELKHCVAGHVRHHRKLVEKRPEMEHTTVTSTSATSTLDTASPTTTTTTTGLSHPEMIGSAAAYSHVISRSVQSNNNATNDSALIQKPLTFIIALAFIILSLF